jgi:uncharacterized protein (TIGR03067 family)
MRAFAAILLLALPALAAPVPKEVKRRPDPELYVGTWETVVSESNGQPYSKARWTFDDKLSMTSNPLPGEAGSTSVWVIKLDPAKTPKTIDIGAYPGIYEFDGADLKIAYTLGGARPAEVKSGDGVYYSVLRRVTDGKK